MAILTLKQLTDEGACRSQVQLFERLFGDAVDVNPILCVAVAPHFNWDWAAHAFLSAPLLAQYEAACAPLWAQYDAAHAPLWAQFDAAHAPLRKQYEAAHAPLWAQYDAARVALWAQYDAARVALWAQYDAARAPLWAQFDAARAALFGELYDAQVLASMAPATVTVAPLSWRPEVSAEGKQKSEAA